MLGAGNHALLANCKCCTTVVLIINDVLIGSVEAYGEECD